jgi:GNAT superfamily N-acetyltransferase
MPEEVRNSFSDSGFILHKVDDFIELQEFDCGDKDLNEFFREDALPHKEELLAEIYSLSLELKKDKYGIDKYPVAYISFHNDAIQLSMRKRKKLLPKKKARYKTLPAVKIGRLGVGKDFQNCNIGKHLVNMTKKFFLLNNRTGCRFITVDSYNHPKVISFYKNNGFKFLSDQDESQATRLMYFDLKRLPKE